MDLKEYNNEMTRYRIIEHQLRDKSVFVVEWNDRWFQGISRSCGGLREEQV